MKKIFVLLLFVSMYIGNAMAMEPDFTDCGYDSIAIDTIRCVDSGVYEAVVSFRKGSWADDDNILYVELYWGGSLLAEDCYFLDSSSAFSDKYISPDTTNVINNDTISYYHFNTKTLLRHEYEDYSKNVDNWNSYITYYVNKDKKGNWLYTLVEDMVYTFVVSTSNTSDEVYCTFEVTSKDKQGIFTISDRDEVRCVKVVRDGQILIQRGDKVYTIQGQFVQ